MWWGEQKKPLKALVACGEWPLGVAKVQIWSAAQIQQRDFRKG